jgi:hypothetical protein
MGKTATIIISLVVLAALGVGASWFANNYQLAPKQTAKTETKTPATTATDSPDTIPTTSDDKDSQFKTFSNAAIGVSFSYPASFKMYNEGENSYSFWIPSKEQYVAYSDRLAVQLVNQTFSYNNPKYSNSGGDIPVNQVEKVTIAGVKGHKIGDGDAGCMSTTYVFPNKAGKIVRISHGICQNQTEIITDAVLAKILDSVKQI